MSSRGVVPRRGKWAEQASVVSDSEGTGVGEVVMPHRCRLAIELAIGSRRAPRTARGLAMRLLHVSRLGKARPEEIQGDRDTQTPLLRSSTDVRRISYVVLVSIGIGLSKGVCAAELTPEQLFRAPVVYKLPEMAAVRVRQDLVYEKADGVELTADVYSPSSPGTFPVVVFVHGGFPEGLDISPKSSGQYTSWGRLVAASGMAAVTFNHRLRMGASGAVHLADAGSDVRSLLKWLRENAERLSLDPRRIAMFA